MTQRTRRLNRNPVVFWSFALLVGLSGTVAKADPLYNLTNLGSGNINLATASGGTIAVSADAPLPVAFGIATSQLASVSNGQVSYSFATTPDTPLVQGQGPLASIPQGLGTSISLYGSPEVSGFLNANGVGGIAVSQSLNSFPSFSYNTAYSFAQNSDGTWGQGALITSSPSGQLTSGGITIEGINTANQVLLKTEYSAAPFNQALVYNINTNALTDLGTLPAITAGGFSNLIPIAIDSQGQVLVRAPFEATANGFGVDTLLLTPGAAAPEPLATPEPSTWLIWTLIGGAAFRFVNRRKGPSDSSRAGRIDPPAPAV
jgi:hypothetical protein